MKIITLDLENDNSIKNCRKYFNFPYRDPENQPWLCTFAVNDGNKKSKITFGIRLPEEIFQREFMDKNGNIQRTGIYHNYDNKFNTEYKVNDCGWIMRKGNYEEFFQKIANIINSDKIDKIYYKGFGTSDNFDYEVLKYWMNKYNINCKLDKLVNVYSEMPTFKMNRTFEQMHKGYVPNEQYMNMAVKHNIEDAELLAKSILEQKVPVIQK